MADVARGDLDRETELKERLRQAPGTEAQAEAMPTTTGPVPTRWTLRTIRATFPWLSGYTLGGVWRVLERSGIRLRKGRTQQFSPDPEYWLKKRACWPA